MNKHFKRALIGATTLQDDEANTSCHFLMQSNLVAVCSTQLIQHYCPDLNIKVNGNKLMTSSFHLIGAIDI